MKMFVLNSPGVGNQITLSEMQNYALLYHEKKRDATQQVKSSVVSRWVVSQGSSNNILVTTTQLKSRLIVLIAQKLR